MFGILQGNGNNLPPGFGGKRDLSNRLGRGDRSPLSIWFWELDRVLLSLILVLIAIGLIAVAAGSLAALFLGFVLGYCCGRKCCKNEEDNMPYPDTEYEYFEQRQNCHMLRRYDPSILELLFSAISNVFSPFILSR